MKASISAARPSVSSPICVPTACRWRPKRSMRRAAPSATSSASRYVPEKARFYSTKAKNAQEAHEAIRPTDFNRTPDQCAQIPRCRPVAALRPDLEARHRQPDGVGRNRAHDGRDHRRQQRPEGRPARRRLRHPLRRLHRRLYRRRRKTASRATTATRMAACRRSMRAKTSPSRRSIRRSISPNRRRAIRKRR